MKNKNVQRCAFVNSAAPFKYLLAKLMGGWALGFISFEFRPREGIFCHPCFCSLWL